MLRDNAALMDQVAYGTASQEDLVNMRQRTFLDHLFVPLQKNAPPKNSSKGVYDELQELCRYVAGAVSHENKNIYDKSLVSYIQEVFKNNGADAGKIHIITQNVVNDVLPLVTRLKYFFQRPRPMQLAYYYNISLHPLFSHFVSSPAFPSGHTTLCVVMCTVLAHQYPDTADDLQLLIADVAESRLYMGVHYASDNDKAMEVAKAICMDPAFKSRYGM